MPTVDVTSHSVVCGVCGQKYMFEHGHTCSYGFVQSPPVQQYYSGLSPMFAVDAETKRLLERIAVALEKLARIAP